MQVIALLFVSFFDLQFLFTKVFQFRLQLSASVPKRAVELYDDLNNELMIRESRTKILASQPPLNEVTTQITKSIEGTTTKLETLTAELDRLNKNEDSLREKIKQRNH
jgi:clusterin-associated protein 1